MGSREIGRMGEALAADLLRRRGYQVIGNQYRCRFGEIDLIVRKRGLLCFVEVKTRANVAVGLPREYVDRRKQERIRATAAMYLKQKGLDCPVRFDVAEVYLNDGEKPRIEYLENAF